MLRFDEVRVRQGDFTLAADFEVPAKEITAVIGPSGSGKSTLLATASGFLSPNSGWVLIQGKDMNAVLPGQRPVSTLFQDGNLFPHLDLQTNIGLGLTSRRLSRDQ
ncbi:MAG: ATP-binding cassette domain-containing protein, partial [Pseudomonadota bacterium]